MRLLLSPPNLLTCARLLLTPYIVLALLRSDCQTALLFSFIAGATDAADGFLARRFHWSSRLGAYLDPIADKLLLTSLYICFSLVDLTPDWLAILVVGRDVLILTLSAAGMLLTSRRDYPPTIWGKVSTALQIAGALIFLTSCAYPDLMPGGLANATTYAVALGTTWSGIHYIWRAFRWSRIDLRN